MFFPILLFVISCILTQILLGLIIKVWNHFGILDRPHLYKSEQGRHPAPYGVGVSIFFILIILSPLVFLFGDFSPLLEKRLFIVLSIGCLISLISWIDDMDTIGKSPIRVPPIIRLLMQISVGAIIGLTSIKISYMSHIFGGIISLDEWYTEIHMFGLNIVLYWIPLCVTILWYVVVFNAVNFSDGVPGLTGGFSLISFIIIGGLALKLYMTDTSPASQDNSRFLLHILAIIIPITFFLTRLDITRKVIIGDSGTIMLAFLIATLSIIGGGKIATAIAVLGIYLVDFVYVVTSRILKGGNPMKGDQSTHLHFRLMELGLTQSQIRIVIYGLSFLFGISALFLGASGKIILFCIVVVITIFLTEILEKVKKK